MYYIFRNISRDLFFLCFYDFHLFDLFCCFWFSYSTAPLFRKGLRILLVYTIIIILIVKAWVTQIGLLNRFRSCNLSGLCHQIQLLFLSFFSYLLMRSNLGNYGLQQNTILLGETTESKVNITNCIRLKPKTVATRKQQRIKENKCS